MNAQPDPREIADDQPDADIDDGFDADIDDGCDDGFDDDPFDSVAEGVPFAHHVISPSLLAGFSGAPVGLCRTLHRYLFEVLDGVGAFDGLIVTPAALIGPGDSTKWLDAFSWLRTSPAPDVHGMYDDHLVAGYDPDEASDHVVHTVTHHSLSLAIELDTNPSFTYASLPALSHALLEMMASEVTKDDVRHIDMLTEMAIALLAITSLECQLEGGARVIDTGNVLDLAQEAAATA